MAARSLFITKPAHLAIQHGNIKIVTGDRTLHMELAQVCMIVLENPQIQLTMPFLQQCLEFGVGIIVCDDRHLPVGHFLPQTTVTRNFGRYALQDSMTVPFMKRAWAKLVSQKIKHQADVCRWLGYTEAYSKLQGFAKQVTSGDTENREGVAAAYYFRVIFGVHFTRDTPCWVNSCLNYGYTIFRSSMAKHVACAGLTPHKSLKHCNQYNAWNLVDDLMEIYRPLVDYYAVCNQGGSTGDRLYADAANQADNQTNKSDNTHLESMHRQNLIHLLSAEMTMQGQSVTSLYSMELLLDSFIRSMESKNLDDWHIPELGRPLEKQIES
jgi:CRISP-associated protein Cas1